MPRKYNLPLTYAPKIAGVLNGSIRQTIRVGRKFSVGDLISFHGWEGKPYRSKWSFRTPYSPLTKVWDIDIGIGGIRWESPGGYFDEDKEWDCAWWSCSLMDDLAKLDGIQPATGKALRDVLFGMHPIKSGMYVEAQIIRW